MSLLGGIVIRGRCRWSGCHRRERTALATGADDRLFKLAMMDDTSLVQGLARDLDGSFELVDALGALPNRYKAAVVLRHVQGLSYAEAAEVLDQPIGTTKSDVHRGVRLLRERLEAELLVEARNF